VEHAPHLCVGTAVTVVVVVEGENLRCAPVELIRFNKICWCHRQRCNKQWINTQLLCLRNSCTNIKIMY